MTRFIEGEDRRQGALLPEYLAADDLEWGGCGTVNFGGRPAAETEPLRGRKDLHA
jgi:hypothetical protein